MAERASVNHGEPVPPIAMSGGSASLGRMLLLRAVVTGFGLALGAAVFKKHVAKRLGLEEEEKKKKDTSEEALAREAPSDPGLQTG